MCVRPALLFHTGLACSGFGILTFIVRERLEGLLLVRDAPRSSGSVDAAVLVLLGVWAMAWAKDAARAPGEPTSQPREVGPMINRYLLLSVGLAGWIYGIFLFIAREDLTGIIRPGISGANRVEGPILPTDAAFLALIGAWAMAWSAGRRAWPSAESDHS